MGHLPTPKKDFWMGFDDLGNLIEGPWFVKGHFNQISYSFKRNGNSKIMAIHNTSMNGSPNFL